jgi:hypothetical protein
VGVQEIYFPKTHLPKCDTTSTNVLNNLAPDPSASFFLVHHVPLRLPVYHGIALAG